MQFVDEEYELQKRRWRLRKTWTRIWIRQHEHGYEQKHKYNNEGYFQEQDKEEQLEHGRYGHKQE